MDLHNGLGEYYVEGADIVQTALESFAVVVAGIRAASYGDQA